MAKRQVFYSFHFDNDVWRVSQIRNIGAIEDNKPVSANEWEEVKKKGEKSIQNWIDDHLKYRSCTIVLVGEKTSKRKWINYEIKKSWNDGKGLLGIYIHNLKDSKGEKSEKGDNPFDNFVVGDDKKKLSNFVKCYDPPYTSSSNVYNYIAENIENWVEDAIESRN